MDGHTLFARFVHITGGVLARTQLPSIASAKVKAVGGDLTVSLGKAGPARTQIQSPDEFRYSLKSLDDRHVRLQG